MTRTRFLNAGLAVLFLLLTLAVPVRGLLWPRDVAAEAIARGEIVFYPDEMNSSARTANYIMLFLFGSLTLVYSARAIRPAKPRAA